MDPYKNPKMALSAVQDAGESGILSGLNVVISTSSSQTDDIPEKIN
jgi:hypothetical protein